MQKLLARKLRRFFAEQAIRVIDRYESMMGVKMAESELLPDDEIRKLEIVIRPILSAAWLQAADLAGELVDADEVSDTDPRLQNLLRSAGVRIQGIHEETLRSVREVLVEGGEQRYSPWQIANGVPKDGFRGLNDVVAETYKGRADTIARTELATASNAASIDRYTEAGVSEVDIVDGPECGWEEHDDPDLANGSRRTLIEFNEFPISHPNCLRVGLPVFEGRR
jgi:hypothetical protein